jgi:hypothetical protein
MAVADIIARAGAHTHLFFVAPKHRRPRLDLGLAQHQVQVHDLVFAVVAHQHQQPALPQLDAILN